MRENKKTPSKCENSEQGGRGGVAGTAGTSPRPSVDDALSKQWQDTRTLVDEMKQLLKLDNSQVSIPSASLYCPNQATILKTHVLNLSCCRQQVAQRSGTSSLNFELWYNKPLECTPAFMDDMTKYLGLWIKKERDSGLQPEDKPRSEGAGESASTKVRKYGKSQRSSKEDAATQNELLSGSFPKTWEDETALERIRRNQEEKNKQAGIVPLQDNIGTKRSFGELGIPTMNAAVKTSKSFPTSFKHGTPIKKKPPIHYGGHVNRPTGLPTGLKLKIPKIPLLAPSSGSGSTMKPGTGPPRASESSSKRVASGAPRLAQSPGSGSTMKPGPGPPRASESSSKRVESGARRLAPLRSADTTATNPWPYQVKALRSPAIALAANMKRMAEAKPSRSDGSGDFRSKEQPKLGLMDDHAVDSVELALHSARESTNKLDELDIASILAFCTAAELAEATNQQESEALACMVLGRMPASSLATAKMRGDTLGKELLRMGQVTRWLSGAIDIVYEVMCEAIRSPEGDLAASLKQVGTGPKFGRPRTAAPQVLVDFAKGLGWNEEGVVVDVTGPS